VPVFSDIAVFTRLLRGHDEGESPVAHVDPEAEVLMAENAAFLDAIRHEPANDDIRLAYGGSSWSR
jgi:hypothetical protein